MSSDELKHSSEGSLALRVRLMIPVDALLSESCFIRLFK